MKLAGAYIDENKHAALTQQAKANFRTLADHIRYIYDQALNGKLVVTRKASNPGKKTITKQHSK